MYFPKCCVKMIFISREWLMFSVLMFIRSSHLYMFFEIVVLKDFANFTEKHLYWSLFLTKLQAWKKRGSKKDRLQHKNLLCNFIVQFIAGACARARVCVCVCVCVYTLLPWNPLLSARFLINTLGVRINDVMLWVSFKLLLPSSFISISKSVIFHQQRRNSSSLTTGEKTKWYIGNLRKDDIYRYRI